MSDIRVEGHTRAAFLLRGALAVGSVSGIGAVGPFVSRAFGAVGAGDIQVLQFALGLEYLEAAFYKAAAAPQGGLTGQTKKLAQEFFNHETTHAQTIKDLITALGAKPNPAPQATFGSLNGQKAFLGTAVKLEELGVAAYNGAAPSLQSADVLEAAGGIVQVEARHAGALRMLAGMDPAPVAFDKPQTPQQVSAAVKPLLQPAAGGGGAAPAKKKPRGKSG